MIGQCEKYGYIFFSPMSFWENANLVFWPCQNSWFWGWKNFFSIAIFHKNHFAYYVLEPFLHQKALKQSICLILAFCATVAQNLWQKMTNTLFESFLVKKWSWLIVTKLNIFKNDYSKKNFQTQNQLFSHGQNTKLAFSLKDIGEKCFYSYFWHWPIISDHLDVELEEDNATAISTEK